MLSWGRKRNTPYIPDLSIQHTFLCWNENNKNLSHRTSFCGLGGRLKTSLAIIRHNKWVAVTKGSQWHFSFWVWPSAIIKWIPLNCTGGSWSHSWRLSSVITGGTCWSTGHPEDPRLSSHTLHHISVIEEDSRQLIIDIRHTLEKKMY